MLWPPPENTELVGSTVRLMPTTREDATELLAALDHDAVWEHVRGRPEDIDDLVATIVDARSRGRFMWTVRLAKPYAGLPQGAVVGTTSFLDVSPIDERLEVGHTTYTPAVWGTSVNPECKRLLLGWAFDTAGFGRVQLKTDVRNIRSKRAITALGARPEGILRRYQRRADGSMRDTQLFSVLVDEWPQVRYRIESRIR